MATRKRAEARNDLATIWSFLAAESVGLADRFIQAVESALVDLEAMPLLGSRLSGDSEATRDVRLWRVRGFGSYVMFYRPADGVDAA